MLPLKQQVSSFETQRSGGHRKPDVEICNKYLAIHGDEGGEWRSARVIFQAKAPMSVCVHGCIC